MNHRLAIFASGFGSNADAICEYFKDHSSVKVELILCDRKEAGVFKVAQNHQVPSIYLDPLLIKNPDAIVNILKEHQITFIILAGFLKLIPKEMVEVYRGRIINIHPALLPKFGGKGMYGSKVHEAVAAAGETETGITIHEVNEHYDEGDIIFQAKTAIEVSDSPQRIAEKIHALEKDFFPRIIEQQLLKAQ
ncbi:phosphoribosylglycinamide formyltransferase [soil metagenome]